MLERHAMFLRCKPEKILGLEMYNTRDLVKFKLILEGCPMGETPMTGFHTWRCMREGVGQDSGYRHEPSHLIHDMKYSM